MSPTTNKRGIMHEREIIVKNALEELNIDYKRYEHESAHTMQRCEHIGEDVGAKHCKNLFLTNRACTSFYLLLMCADKPFKTSDISKQLGSSRLSFASDDLLLQKLDLLPGAVSPLALTLDTAKDIKVAIDKDLLLHDMICVHPCVSTVSYAMQTKELLRFLLSCSNPLSYVTIMGNSKAE